MHARKQIRDALTTAVTGLTTTGSTVGDSVYPENVTPSLRVLFVQEPIPDELQTADVYDRIAEFDIEIRVTGADYQDQIDQISGEVETAIEADPSLGLTGVKVQLVATGPGDTDDSGDVPKSFMPMRYAAHYRTEATAPDTLVN